MVAWGLWGALMVTAAGALVLAFVTRNSPHTVYGGQPLIQILNGMALATVAALVASRHPRNPVGWLFFVVALGNLTTNFASVYAIEGVEVAPGSLPAPQWVAWAGTWSWILQVVGLSYLALLFPNGRPPSRRWSWLVIVFAISELAFLAVWAANSWPAAAWRLDAHGEIDIPTPPTVALVLMGVNGLCMGAAAAGLITRLRRSRGDERQQLKWFVFAGSVVAILAVVLMFSYAFGLPDWEKDFLATATNVTPMLLGIAAAIAIFRYRLYDIDIVISRTVLFGVMAAFITGVYIAVVVGVGTFIGAGGRASVGLSIAATILVSLAFQPVAGRVQHFANRLVYGPRATPYEVMADFAERMSGAVLMTAALPEMAAAAAAGVGARAARVRVVLRDGTEEVHSWPPGADGETGSDNSTPGGDGVSLRLPVRHAGEEVGELAVTKAAGDPVTPAEESLLEDLAAQAGVVMENVRLARELEARLDQIERQAAELAASRTRIMAAADAERRSLGSRIDEGISLELRAMAADIRATQADLEAAPEAAATRLGQLGEQANRTLDELRDLARGIFPPLLVDQGLVPALRAHARKTGADLDLDGAVEERFPSEVEAALYFCILEALHGVARAGGEGTVRVQLASSQERVSFALESDGAAVALDEESALGMTDRVGALGGEFHRGGPGEALVSGWVPLEVAEPVPV